MVNLKGYDKVTVFMLPELKAKLKDTATAQGQRMGTYIRWLLIRTLSKGGDKNG